MDNFATLKFIDEFEKVIYYSVVLNGDEEQESLYEEFVKRWEKENLPKLTHIQEWIRLVGDRYGAQDIYFRPEKKALALPPRGIKRSPSYLHFGKATANNLRLYCHKLNEHVVVLFTGAEKTADEARDCNAVRQHFDLANKLALAIDECIREGLITWDDDLTNISYELNLKIEI